MEVEPGAEVAGEGLQLGHVTGFVGRVLDAVDQDLPHRLRSGLARGRGWDGRDGGITGGPLQVQGDVW